MTGFLQAAATAAALALMYLVCIRPMMRRNGTCHMPTRAPSELDGQIRLLREEVTLLLHEVDLRRSPSRQDGED